MGNHEYCPDCGASDFHIGEPCNENDLRRHRAAGQMQEAVEASLKCDKYLQSGGTICPKCYSDDIIGERIVLTKGSAYQDLSCFTCNAEWRDVYTLSHYTIMEAR